VNGDTNEATPAFAAPSGKASGVNAHTIHADLVILPGGLLLVNVDSKLSKLAAFSGNKAAVIECKGDKES